MRRKSITRKKTVGRRKEGKAEEQRFARDLDRWTKAQDRKRKMSVDEIAAKMAFQSMETGWSVKGRPVHVNIDGRKIEVTAEMKAKQFELQLIEKFKEDDIKIYDGGDPNYPLYTIRASPSKEGDSMQIHMTYDAEEMGLWGDEDYVGSEVSNVVQNIFPVHRQLNIMFDQNEILHDEIHIHPDYKNDVEVVDFTVLNANHRFSKKACDEMMDDVYYPEKDRKEILKRLERYGWP